MSITFRPGVRENVGLWVNLVGGTGSGKTRSGMRLATGMSGGKPFALIDTENRRGLHYADDFKFDHADLRAPFSPDSYTEAIVAADKAGYPVIVVDSGSHAWAGDGGMLDMQEAELDRMAGNDYAKRERVKMSAWIKPKSQHKKMVSKLLALRAHLIFCLRAEKKIEMVKVDGKLVIQDKQTLTGLDGWIPICDKNLPFEATASFLLMADHPGIPRPIKLQEQHRSIFPLDKPITEESGRLLAAWASGAKESAPPANSTSARPSQGNPPPGAQESTLDEQAGADPIRYVSADEALELESRCEPFPGLADSFKRTAGVERFGLVQLKDLARATDWLNKAITKRQEKAA